MRSFQIIVAAENSPENPHNGIDIRIWNLVGQGSARVVCLRRKEYDDRGQPLVDRLPWAGMMAAGDIDRLTAGAEAERISPFQLLVIGKRLGKALTMRLPGRCFVDLVDSMALYHWRRAKFLAPNDPLRSTANLLHSCQALRDELAIARCAKATIVSSQVDARVLQRFGPGLPILAVGNGTTWLERSDMEPFRCRPKRLMFHANFSWFPNISALCMIVEHFWPVLRRVIPGAELHVVGVGLPEALKARCEAAGITVRGFVEDAFAAVAEAGVYLAPMAAGSGVKNKISEAMAAGVPVATNSLGAEALPPAARKVALVADDPSTLAKMIADLVEDPVRFRSLRVRTRTAAEKCFDWRVKRADLAAVLADVSQIRTGKLRAEERVAP